MILAALLSAAACALQALEVRWLKQPLLESLVLAILLGVVYRNSVGVGRRMQPGLCLCGKQVLEVAVVLLGGTMNLRQIQHSGPKLLLAVALLVFVSLGASTMIGRRLFGLQRNPATLIAVGNAICGNSAIAAIAPLIGASSAEVAGAVAFTAVLGVVLVLALPLLLWPLLLSPLLHFTQAQYGVLAGMTVYAVPQVLAASFPVGELAGQTATLVKLTRVLMLLPVALWYSLKRGLQGKKRPALSQLVPWFIAGFLVLAVLRTLGIVPAAPASTLREISRLLTVVAMAALGLGVDLRALGAAGTKTIGAISLSLLLLLSLSVGLVKLLNLS